MLLAERLSAIRVERGLSRRSLSLAANLSESMVGQIERGDIANPSVSTISALATVLGVSVDSLLGRLEPTTTEAA